MSKEYYTKEKEIKNNLLDYLNDLSDEELDIIISNIDSYKELKTRNKKIEFLNKIIPEKFKEFINNNLNFTTYKILNSKKNTTNEYLLDHGYMFHYHSEDEKCKIVIPNEIKEIFKEFIKNKKDDYLYNTALNTIRNYLVINSYIPKKILKKIILNEKELEVTNELFESIIKDNNIKEYKDYYTDLDNFILDSLENRKTDAGYKTFNIDELNYYCKMLSEFLNKLYNLIGNNDKLIYYHIVAFSGNSNKDTIEYIKKNYQVDNDKIDKIRDLLDEYRSEIRFWNIKGRTEEESWNEIFIESGILNNKPKKINLLNCLKEMNQEGLDLIKKYYNIKTDDLKKLKDKIIEKLSWEIQRYSDDYINELVVYNDTKYDDFISSNLIYGGLVFLYLDDDIKYILPEEIKNYFINYLKKTNELNKLISGYLQLNGVIDIDVLLDLINKNHNLNITKQDILEYIKEMDIPFNNNKYLHLIKDSTSEDIKNLLDFKNLNKDYKILDLNEPLYIDNLFDEAKLLGNEYENLIKEYIVLPLLYGIYNGKALQTILKQENKLKYYNVLNDIANKYKYKVGVWRLNGYPLENKTIVKTEKIGRNDPCPCGSGKKYKKCCGK